MSRHVPCLHAYVRVTYLSTPNYLLLFLLRLHLPSLCAIVFTVVSTVSFSSQSPFSEAVHQQHDFSSLNSISRLFHCLLPAQNYPLFALFAAMRDLNSLVSFSFSRGRIRVYSFALFSLMHPFVSYFFLRLFLTCPLPSASDSTTPGFPLLCSSSFFFVPVACLLFLFSVASMAASSIGNPPPPSFCSDVKDAPLLRHKSKATWTTSFVHWSVMSSLRLLTTSQGRPRN